MDQTSSSTASARPTSSTPSTSPLTAPSPLMDTEPNTFASPSNEPAYSPTAHSLLASSSSASAASASQGSSRSTLDTDVDMSDDDASSTRSYKAPLSGSVGEPSLDGTTYDGEAVRPTKAEDVSDEDKATALSIKSQANALFGQSRYHEAANLYTLSLNKNPFDPAVWSNRAATRLKLEEHGLAISDCTEALALDPRYVKAYYRRALANLAIVQAKSAIKDFRVVMRLQPANTAAKIQLESTEKLIRRLEFDKAIASREEPSAIEKCSDQLKTGMDIEASYAGPRLRTDSSGSPEITQSFLDQMVTFFKDGKVLPRRIAWQIVLGAYNALSKEPSLVETTISQGQHIDVLGDTHGQYWDLCHCLKLTGQPGSDHKMVFNGDFVDRGSWSTEVVLTLFAYKWLYPEQVFLNRGNHETSDMNKVYGFEGETKKKYSEMTYKLFEEVFAALPIATLVTASCPPAGPVDARLPSVPILHKGTRRYLILHGGLFSKDETSLADVRKIQRLKSKQPQSGTIMSEALWSDPQAWPGRGPSKRGIGLDFGPDVTQRFAKTNELTGIIRSHEVRQEGYSIEHDGLCMTVFSAPNYIDQVGNKAAFIRISDDGKLDFETYEAQPHPAIRPMAYAASGFAQGMM